MDNRSLCLRYLMGDATDEEVATLSAWIAESPENAQAFALLSAQDAYMATAVANRCKQIDQDSGLLEELAALERRARPIEPLPPIHIERSNALTKREIASALTYVIKHTFTPNRIAVLSSAAASAAVLALVIVLLWPRAQQPVNVPVAGSTPEPERALVQLGPVATLTAQRDAQWAERAYATGAPLQASQSLTLTAGFAEITTSRGAVVLIEAPATVKFLDNDNALRLLNGKLVGICETDDSKGFLVRTPHMDITDLGTRFGVAIDDAGNALAEVFEGLVETRATGSATNTIQSTQLTAGQSIAINRVGQVIGRERFDRDVFADLVTSTASVAGVAELAGEVRWSPNVFTSLDQADWPTNTNAMLVEELRGHRLTADVRLTLQASGRHQQFNPSPSPATVPAETVIRSYALVHHPPKDSGEPNNTCRGSVTFDSEILGVITNQSHAKGFLDANDSELEGLLPQAIFTGLESVGPRSTPELSDLIEISDDRRTLTFKMLTSSNGQATDAFRVIVREPTGDTQP